MQSILKDNPIPLGEAEDSDLESNVIRLTRLMTAVEIGGNTLSPTLKILEVGCGTADFLMYLRKAGLNVIGVEARPRGSNADEVIASKIEQMPFADASFDLVFSSLVFDLGAYHQNHRQMLAEISRVLKAGGLYVSRGDEIKARSASLRFIKKFGVEIPMKVYRKL